MSIPLLIVESNALFAKDVDTVVSGALTRLLKEARTLTEFELAIPNVAIAEIIVRKSWHVERLYEETERGLKKLGKHSAIAPLEVAKNFKAGVVKTLRKWCKENQTTMLPVPYRKIDWPALSRAALWRKPPFEGFQSDKEKDKEKGFKDALIIETICATYASNPNRPLHIVEPDGEARRAIEARISKQSNVTLHKTVESFLSPFRIAKQQSIEIPAPEIGVLEREPQPGSTFVVNLAAIPALDPFGILSENPVINEYVSKAASLFYTEHDYDTMYFRFNVEGLIKSDGAILDGTLEYNMTFGGPAFVSAERVKVCDTIYESEDTFGRTQWQTEVRLRRLFQTLATPDEPTPNTYIIAYIFIVTWSARFSIAEAQFVEENVEAVTFDRQEYEYELFSPDINTFLFSE